MKPLQSPVKADVAAGELTLRAVFLGVILAVILGAVNVYLGLRTGMTVAAPFPAAVAAMAILRRRRGSLLEENIARTTGTVGEALAAGAIFTIPAFVMAGVWVDFGYWQSMALMSAGGLLGVLFVVLVRRTLVQDRDLPFPESVACTEIVRENRGGSTGVAFILGSLGLASVVEFFKNPSGMPVIKDVLAGFLPTRPLVTIIRFIDPDGKVIALRPFEGRFFVESPLASPAVLGLGYIIGPRLSSLVFSGGCFGWLLLLPLALMLSGHDLDGLLGGSGGSVSWPTVVRSTYDATIKPVAVGAMLVGALHTLYSMRKSLAVGISRVLRNVASSRNGAGRSGAATRDLPLGTVLAAIAAIVIPMTLLYHFFCRSLGHSIVAVLVMTAAGFLFAAAAGYLVGLIGSSSNPISGMTLITLLAAALLLGPVLGLTGSRGVTVILGIAAVVCCSASVAGDVMQNWKIGHLLQGIPWKMQVGGLIGVAAASLVLPAPLLWLHGSLGIGSNCLPAPQAGLMFTMAKGIAGGGAAWPLIITGMVFSFALILMKSPSPMLIAVGMYLPFSTTFALFAGGVFKWLLEKLMGGIGSLKARERALESTGTLLASGLVTGEAVTSIVLAAVHSAGLSIRSRLHEGIPESNRGTLGLTLMILVFIAVACALIYVPFRDAVMFERREKEAG
jgi:OPT family oligopeptide transporter